MPVFPDAWLNELKNKTDIVSLVSEYIPLKQKGKRFWGCCPFHTEKTPSFSVSPDNQMFYCFGCHAGGSMVQFVMQIERLQYGEAISFLAKRANMELPSEIDSDKLREARAKKERLYSVCKDAALFYHRYLMSSNGYKAREYLKQRGIGDRVCKRFGLGYAPAGFENTISYLKKKGHSEQDIYEAGLAVKRKDGSLYDAYRDRIIFPIISTMSKVLGFGARTLNEDEKPKYINTGDTPIYQKRENIYALNLIKGKQIKDIILVEGYIDVISLHAHGVENAVASLGTALTDRQARLLKRFAELMYICYDGDDAGQNATARAIDILTRENIEVKVIVIPGGLDPDDYVKEHGAEAFLALKDSALTFTTFRLDYLSKKFDLSNIDDREKYAKQACRIIAALDPVERTRYMEYLSKKTGIAINVIREQCGAGESVHLENNAVVIRNNSEKQADYESDARGNVEATLLACIAGSREVARRVSKDKRYVDSTIFTIGGNRTIASQIIASYNVGRPPDVAIILSNTEQAVDSSVIRAMQKQMDEAEAMTTAENCMLKLQTMGLLEKKQRLLEKLKNADDETKPKLLIKISEVIRAIDELRKA